MPVFRFWKWRVPAMCRVRPFTSASRRWCPLGCYETCAFVGLFLKEPSDFDRVVAALREMPEVVECHYTTGGYDIFIKIYTRNNSHMLSFIHDKLQPLGLQRSETIISLHEAFHRKVAVPDFATGEGGDVQ